MYEKVYKMGQVSTPPPNEETGVSKTDREEKTVDVKKTKRGKGVRDTKWTYPVH